MEQRTPNPSPRKGLRVRARRFCRLACRPRYILLGVLVLGILSAGGVWLVLASPLTRWVVMGAIERSLPLDASAARVRLSTDGLIRIENLRLAVTGDPAGSLLEADTCLIDPDWSTLFADRLRIREIALDRARTRVSVEKGTGRVNLQPLLGTSRAKGRFDVPAITLHDATLEFGEHDATTFTPLESLRIDGLLSRTHAGDAFSVALSERTGPIRVHGSVTPDGATFEASEVDLGRFAPAKLPQDIRGVMRLLDLRGRVPSVRIDYARDTGLVAGVSLAGVQINLPFDRDGDLAESPTDLARMTGVSGNIRLSREGVRASLRGWLEDLEYRAELASRPEGDRNDFRITLSTDSFVLEQQPRLIPYVPRAIEAALDDFSHPTGIIDASIAIDASIDESGRVSRVRIASGQVQFRAVRATHVRFPYELADVSGTIRFDESQARLIDVRGTSKSGATLEASGSIAPLSEHAVLTLNATLANVPLDDALARALPSNAQDALEELFSAQRLAELRAMAPDLDLAQSLDDFSPGASADVTIDLVSPASDPASTRASATIRLAHAALLPRRFPLPILARGVLIHADNDRVSLQEGTFRTLAGDTLSLQGSITFATNDAGDLLPIPDMRLRVRDASISRSILHAISQAGNTPEDPRPWTRRMLLALGMSGLFDADVHILNRDSGDVGFNARIAADNLTFTPSGADSPAPLTITQSTGVVLLDESSIDVDVSGIVGDPSNDPAHVHSKALVLLAGRTPRVHSRTVATNLDASLGIERLVGAFSRGAARELISLRAQTNPTGRADTVIEVLMPSIDDDPTVRVDLSNARSLALDTPLGRLALDNSLGTFSWITPARFDFASLQADASIDARPEGRLALDGSIEMLEGSRPANLHLRTTATPLEGTLARKALDAALGSRNADLLRSAHLAGLVDADILAVGDLAPNPTRPPDITGQIRPVAISLDLDGQRVHLADMLGSISFDRDSAQIHALEASLAHARVTLTGSLRRDPARTYSFAGSAALTAPSLTSRDQANLPRFLRDPLASIRLEAASPISLDITTLTASLTSDASIRSYDAHATFALADASLHLAVPFQASSIAGRLALTREAAAPASIAASIESPALTAAGITMTGASALLRSAPDASLWIEQFSAQTHEGRVAGDLILRNLASRESSFDLRLAVSEVDLAPVLRDLASSGSAPPRPDAEIDPLLSDDPTTDLPSDPPTTQRGRLHAELTVSGRIDDPASRRGRGSARIFGGRVVDLPLLLQLVRVANLRLPSSEDVDLAVASFYIDGPRVVFEDLSAFAGDVEIFGFGSLTLPDHSLDLRFVPRTVESIPLLAPLVRGINRELLTVRVRGTLEDREINTEILRGTRALVGRVTGSTSEADELLDRFEKQAERSRNRLLRMTDRPLPENP